MNHNSIFRLYKSYFNIYFPTCLLNHLPKVEQPCLPSAHTGVTSTFSSEENRSPCSQLSLEQKKPLVVWLPLLLGHISHYFSVPCCVLHLPKVRFSLCPDSVMLLLSSSTFLLCSWQLDSQTQLQTRGYLDYVAEMGPSALGICLPDVITSSPLLCETQ